MSELPYRPNVCMLVYRLVEGAVQIWIGQRLRGDTWQLPQGGAKKRLSLEENVRLELREELGLKARHLGSITRLEATNRYDFAVIPERWKKKYRGQAQTFWLVQFLGHDEDVDLQGDGHPEFSDWAWCPLEEVLERVEPLRRPGYTAAIREATAVLAPRKVRTFLMFNGRAREAVELYLSLLPNSRLHRLELQDDKVRMATFSLAGHELMAFDSPATHDFSFTPSTSLFVECVDEEELDHLFGALSVDGKILMGPDSYDFSRKFAWVSDRFGVSWQLNLC